MKRFYSISKKLKLVVASALLLCGVAATAQTTLSPGDLSIIGFNSNSSEGNPSGFSFVTWVDLEVGTVIKFTDNGFRTLGGASTDAGNYRNKETIGTWTATVAINGGSVISVEGGTATSGNFSVIQQIDLMTPDPEAIALANAGGDQLFAYQGAGGSPDDDFNATFTGTLLYGVAYNGTWLSSGSPDSQTSYLPSDITNFSVELTNSSTANYSGPRTGLSEAALKAAINDPNNWTGLPGTNEEDTLVVNEVSVASGIAVSPGTLASTGIGNAYSVQLDATGGTAPYDYTIGSGALPGGITLSPTGLLSGTPTATGTFTFVVHVEDDVAATVDWDYTLVITAPDVVVNPTSITTPQVGAAYSQTITGSGGIAPYTFSVSAGTLPIGLALDGNTGVISGTPITVAAYSFTITAQDASLVMDGGPYSGSRTYSGTVADPNITVDPATLTAATVGTAYSQTISASGGTAPYTYAVTAGTLPAGVSLVSDVLSGTPTEGGSFSFTITATDDSNGAGAPFTGSTAYTWTVNAPTIVVAPTSLPGVILNTSYSQTVSASGGTAPYTFAVTSGSLPTGLSLDGSSGDITGTATVANTFNFTITATDNSTGSGPYTGSRAYTITVSNVVVVIDQATISDATAGAAYSTTLTASGGTGPYTFAVTSGALPTGLSLDGSSGVISGTATQVGAASFTITATDDNMVTGSQAYSISVFAPTITVSPATIGNGTVGTAYSETISASGGNSPYTFTTSSGSFPAGVTLSTGGAITGTPTEAGSFTVTVKATDVTTGTGAPFFGTRSYSFDIAAPTITITTASLSAATVGASHTQTLSSTGGTSPYTYAVTIGTLPDGITLSSGGVLSGTATEGGSFNITISSTDNSTGTGAPFSITKAFTLVVNGATITLPTTSLSNAAVASAYSTAITAATGGTAPYTYAVTAGSLPAGLSMASDGTISGTPTAGGTFNFTTTATDASTGTGPYTGTQNYTLIVDAPTITVSPASATNGTAGAAYTETFTASGGTSAYTFAVSAGTEPTGLTLSSAGVLSGTPTEAGTFNFTVTATDASTGSGPYSGSTAYSVTIAAPVIVLPSVTITDDTVGFSYSFVLDPATGGTSPYTYAVTGGSLPTGITLTSGGALTGVATEAGAFNFTVTVTDNTAGTGSPFTASQSYTLNSLNTVDTIVTTGANPTNDLTVYFDVIFDAPVTGVSATNFATVVTGTVTGESIGTPTGSGSTWNVPVSYTSGVGTLGLKMVNSTGLSATFVGLPFTGDTFSIAPPCVADAGVAAITGPAAFCGSGAATISSTGYSTSTSLYQWEYSSDNFVIDVNDLSGEVDPDAMTTPTLTSTTYFRLRVDCPLGGTDYSNSVTVTINTGTPASFAAIAPICVDAPAITLTQGSPNNPNGTYSGKGVSGGMFDPAVAGTGTHTLIYQYTDLNLCTTSASRAVLVNGKPVVSLANFAAVCQDAAPFALSGGLPGAGTYSGTGVSGNVFTPANANVGLNTITFTYTRPSTGCTNSVSKDIQVRATPSVTIDPVANLCESAASVTLSGTPAGGTFSGTGVSGSSFDPAVSGDGSFTLSYTYSDAFSCAATATTSVTVNPKPTVSLTSFSNVCSNGPLLTLSGGSPAGGTYSGDGVTGGSFDPSSVSIGSHTITYSYTDANGCDNSASKTITVTTPTTLTLPSGTSMCVNAATFTITGASPMGGTFSGSGVSGNSFSPATAGAGPHVITYSYTNGDGCLSSGTFTVQVDALPTPTITAATLDICPGESTTLSTAVFDVYQWYKDGEGISGAESQTYDATQAGVYTVEVSDATTCSNVSAGVTVTLKTAPTPTITLPSAPNFCSNSTITLGTQSYTSYQWNRDLSPINTNGSNSTYDAGVAGSYTVTVVAANGCSGTSPAVTVSGSSAVVVSASRSTDLCIGDSVILTSSSASSYQWYRNNSIIGGATSISYTVKEEGLYKVIAMDAFGCSATSAQVTVTKYTTLPSPTISIVGDDEFCDGGNNRLVTENTFSSYQWYRNNAKITGATFSSINNSKGGEFTVQVADANGCKDFSDPTTVTVNPLPVVNLNVPSMNDICSPDSLVLSAGATANTVYNWTRNGEVIVGAASGSYAVKTTGLYQLNAQTEKGCMASSKIILVNVKPGIDKPTVSNPEVNTLVSTSPTANQWYKDGVELAGEINQELTITTNGNYTVVVTGANGCERSSDVFAVVNLEVASIDAKLVWSSFPNPFKEIITVQTNGSSDYQVVDMQGRTVATGTFQTGRNQLNLNKLAKGMYHLKSIGATETVVVKIIKE